MDTPLTARSVLLSLLLGTDPPRLPVGRLVRATTLFGIQEGTTRTALSRLVTAGEVANRDGWYGLTSPRLLARQARQTASRRGYIRPWTDQRWLMAVVVAPGRRPAAERAALRSALSVARLGELREGVWTRPDNLPDVERSVNDSTLVWFHTTPTDDPAELARRLWDLDAWTVRANVLIGRVTQLTAPLTAHDHRVLADGFVTSAAVLRHLQADPLLPRELLPPTWPGDDLRHAYDHFDTAYRSLLRQWFEA